MPNVASKANVHHQPALPGARPRTGGPQAPNTSPFAMLLDSGDAAPAPKPQRSDRAQPSVNARASSAGDSKREQPTAATREAAETEQQPQASETEQQTQAPATEPTAAVDESKAAKAETALDPFAIVTLAEGEAKAEGTAAIDIDLSLLTATVTDKAAITPNEPPGLAVALAATAEIETTPRANAEAVQLAVASGAAKAAVPGAQAPDAAAVKGQGGDAAAPNETDHNAAKAANPAPIAPQAEAKTEAKPAAQAEAKTEAKPEAPAAAGVKAEAAQGAKESNAAVQAEGKHDNLASRPQDAAQKPAEPSPARFEPQARDTADLAKPGPDGAQLSAMHITTERFGNLAAQATQPVGAAAASVANAAVPIAGLAVEIAARAQAGGNRFEIRLDPPELGRIDVRLDVDRSGQVTSRLVVEKAETLDLLRRDAAELERALQQAGLKTAENGMQFTLRDQSFAGRDGGPAAGSATLIAPDSELGPAEILAAGYGRVLRPGGGIDIRV